MEQNYSQLTSPLLGTEDYDDFKRWQERQHAIGPKVRTLVLLALCAWMSYAEYAAMRSRNDQVLAQHSALQAQYDSLKAQYDRIEAKKDETLARYSALKTQYDQIEAMTSETLAHDSALKAQYDRIEAMRNESLAQDCASEAQHAGNAKKGDNIPNSLRTPQ